MTLSCDNKLVRGQAKDGRILKREERKECLSSHDSRRFTRKSSSGERAETVQRVRDVQEGARAVR
jgi:hypothetical protein